MNKRLVKNRTTPKLAVVKKEHAVKMNKNIQSKDLVPQTPSSTKLGINEEQRQELIRLLQQGEEFSPEWARILFPPEKREYELVYHGKEREEDIIANTLAVPLQKIRTFGKNGDGWHNQLIFGDNLQVMKSLIEQKRLGNLCNADGTPGVRLIYIDPPFASKQEFKGSEAQAAYQDKVAGAKFLEFLRKRMILLKQLLSEDGTIYVHLDYRKLHYIKALGDEIFGEQNFLNEIIWCYRERGISKTFWNNKHQTILVWAKNKGQQYFDSDSARIPYSEEYLKKFKYEDNEGLYQIRGKNIKGSPVQRADGLTPDAEKKYPGLTYRQYLKDGQLPLDWWELSLLNKAAHERTGYPTQKPEALLKRVIKASSKKGDLVLDCFAGSGTTLAAAEKLGRRWIGIDCGKLSIYTIQKRLHNVGRTYDLEAKEDDTMTGELAKITLQTLSKNKNDDERISTVVEAFEKVLQGDYAKNKPSFYSKPLQPFALYTAGLYDFTQLKDLPWDAWHFFALQLFQCRYEPHKIGGIHFDGYLKGASVLVFNHQKQPGVRIDEETIQSMHEALGTKIGSRMFIIAPALVFDFQQDYLTLDGIRYYALRIPYSIIHELHQREFTALKQPVDEMAVNDTVEAVGFDFVRRPELEYDAGVNKGKGGLGEEGFIKIKTFKSEAAVRNPGFKKGNRETLSMVMLDYDFDSQSDVFDLDVAFYAEAIEKDSWEIRFPIEAMGEKIMAVFVDIYGNEAREVIPSSKFNPRTKNKNKSSGSTKKVRK